MSADESAAAQSELRPEDGTWRVKSVVAGNVVALVLVGWGFVASGGYSLDHYPQGGGLENGLDIVVSVLWLGGVTLFVAEYVSDWGARVRSAHIALWIVWPIAITALVVSTALGYPGQVLEAFGLR